MHPTDPIILRRGMMYLDPDSRAIEHMRLLDKKISVSIWRKTSLDNIRPWKQDTVLNHCEPIRHGQSSWITHLSCTKTTIAAPHNVNCPWR